MDEPGPGRGRARRGRRTRLGSRTRVEATPTRDLAESIAAGGREGEPPEASEPEDDPWASFRQPIEDGEPAPAAADADRVAAPRPPFARRRAAVVVAAALVVALVAAVVVALSSDGDPAPPTTTTTTTTTQLSAGLTIAELLPLDTQFATYSELIDGSDLAELLDGDEPVTVLIPEEAAWPEDGPADRDAALAEVSALVLPGSITAQGLADRADESIENLDGDGLEVRVADDGSISVAGATIAKRDIVASNGMIHVVGSLPDA